MSGPGTHSESANVPTQTPVYGAGSGGDVIVGVAEGLAVGVIVVVFVQFVAFVQTIVELELFHIEEYDEILPDVIPCKLLTNPKNPLLL